MEMNVYSKSDILEKLANDGFFVDYLTLDSFLGKYKIEAIFENEDGEEFFDISSYDILVKNVLKKDVEAPEPTETEHFEMNLDAVEPQEISPESAQAQEFKNILDNNTTQEQDLNSINWHSWAEETLAEPTEVESQEENEVTDDEIETQTVQEEIIEDNTHESIEIEPQVEDNNQQVEAQNQEQEQAEKQEEAPIILSKNDNEQVETANLLEEVQKLQGKILENMQNQNKQNDETPQNAFKFDISENTLNMIAGAIAKKIANQVTGLLNLNKENETKLIESKKENDELVQKVDNLEEENKKLRLLLAESNKNLNSYRPSIFGFYRFKRQKEK